MGIEDFLNKIDQTLNKNNVTERISQAINQVNHTVNQKADLVQKSIHHSLGLTEDGYIKNQETKSPLSFENENTTERPLSVLEEKDTPDQEFK